MREYEKLLKTRETNIYGVGPWYWIAEDNGAWEGPNTDWASHLTEYKKFVKNWGVVVQAGGCQGMYPRLFSDHFERVYTFEPDPLNFICLVNNCQKDNIFKMQAALGAERGWVRVSRNTPTNTGMNTVRTDQGTCYIPMLTIDSLVLDRCDLIQLDIEGYEANAIKGGINTIEQFKPVIACERGNDAIFNQLKPLGYEVASRSFADTIYVSA